MIFFVSIFLILIHEYLKRDERKWRIPPINNWDDMDNHYFLTIRP